MGVSYWRFRSYLPSFMRDRLESWLLARTPEVSQMEKVERLGERIGLTRREVQAAYSLPANVPYQKSRLAFLMAIVMIIAVLVVSFLIFALPMIYNPPSTYAYGSRYGSIKPKDFIQKSRLRE